MSVMVTIIDQGVKTHISFLSVSVSPSTDVPNTSFEGRILEGSLAVTGAVSGAGEDFRLKKECVG